MRLKQIIPIILILNLSAVTIPSPSISAEIFAASGEVLKGEVVVEIKPGASIDAVNARHGTTTIKQIYGTNYYRLATRNGKKEKRFKRRLSKDPDVLSASLNPVVLSPGLFARATASFPDGFARPGLTIEDFNEQAELFELLNLEEIGMRSRGADVVVAVVDSGVDPKHPALQGRLWTDSRNGGEIPGDGIDNDGDGLVDDYYGWDFVDNKPEPWEIAADPFGTMAGHGTFIAGLIAMLAPEARIMPIRAFPPEGISDAFTVAEAVKYAADHGAHVINLSLGSSDTSDLLESAILDARRRGITVVAAVGNENSDQSPQFPSNMSDVIAVAAVELDGRKAAFSNYGSHVDVSAPGVRLVSTYPITEIGDYAEWSGTSFAAPLTSAQAALILSIGPRNTDVRAAIEKTAVDINNVNPDFENKLGRGLINPLGALRSVSYASARATLDLHCDARMARGPATPRAFGRAVISVFGEGQAFAFEAHNLKVRASYRLMVNDEVVASNLQSSSLGVLKVLMTNDSAKSSLPAALDPVTGISRVRLLDSADRVVLESEIEVEGTGSTERFIERETALASTGIVALAGGRAVMRAAYSPDSAPREELRVSAEGLTPGAAYLLLINGQPVRSFIAASGFFRAVFKSDGSGAAAPPALTPIAGVGTVELVDAGGQPVLQGGFPSRVVVRTGGIGPSPRGVNKH